MDFKTLFKRDRENLRMNNENGLPTLELWHDIPYLFWHPETGKYKLPKELTFVEIGYIANKKEVEKIKKEINWSNTQWKD